jgi:hypothetical protein
MLPNAPYLQSTRLLDQVCELVWHLHYSFATKKITFEVFTFLSHLSAMQSGAMRHPS